MDVGNLDPLIAFALGNDLPFVIEDFDAGVFGKLMPRFDDDFGVVIGEFGFDFNAARAQIIELKVNVPDANELHVAIDAAIESEISGLRIDPLVGAVIDANGQ